MAKKNVLLFMYLGIFLINCAPAYASDNLSVDILVYYNFDEQDTSGVGTIYDSLMLNNATNNGTSNITGKIKTAYDYDGSDDKINIPPEIITAQGTVSLWVNPDVLTGDNIMISSAIGDSDYAFLTIKSDGRIQMDFTGSLTSLVSNTGVVSAGGWYNVIYVSDGISSSTIYVNGENETSSGGNGQWFDQWGSADTFSLGVLDRSTDYGHFDGVIDEVGIWNRTLIQSEINQLYNEGAGLSYPFSISEIFINLVSPENDSTISDIGTNFIVSGGTDVDNFNTTNLTYYVWDTNGSIHNITTIILAGSQTFNEILFIDNFTIKDYIWNARVCYENSTFSNCTFADNNFTFSVNIFKDISVSYDTEITEGASNIINRTISIFPDNTFTGALLEYNGTNYSTSLLFSDGVYIVGATLVAPTVSVDTNFTFTFYYLIDGVYYPSDEENQTVSNTLFGICGGISNDTLINLFLLNEETKSNITGNIDINAEVVSMTSGETVGTLNGSFSDIENVSLCFTPPSVYASYYLNAEIRYGSDDYVSEFYYIQNSDLENYPANLSLFLLSINDSTEFVVTYKSDSFIFIEDAIIQLQRKYIGENVYRTVEAPLTSDGGKVILHIDLNSIKYQASVVKDGELLDFFDNVVFSCDNELSGDCTYSFDGTVDPNNDISIEDLTDFSYSISINEDNQTVTVLFAVPSGTPSSISVSLEQLDMFGNITSCNTTIITSAGSIECDYTDTIEKSLLELSISKDGVQLAILSYVNDPDLDMDGMNFFIVFLFMISLVGMAIASPEWMILISVMVLMISGMLLLLQGMSLVMGLGAIAWVVVAAAIIIFKMAKQEDR